MKQWWVVGMLACLSSMAQQPPVDAPDPARVFDERFWEAKRLMAIGEKDLAAQMWVAAAEADPTHPVPAYERAIQLAEQQRMVDALEQADIALQADPTNPWFLRLKAGILRYLARYDQELPLRTTLVEQEPTNPDALFEVALVHGMMNNYALANATAEQVEVMMGGITPFTGEFRAQNYLKDNKLEEAVAVLFELYAATGDADYLGQIGQAYSQNNQDKKALKVFEGMLKTYPDDPRVHIELARLYQAKGDVEQALYHLKQAMASTQLPFEPKSQVLVSFLNEAGKDPRFDAEGLELARLTAQAHPEEASAQAIWGAFAINSAQYDEALEAYRRAFALDPRNEVFLEKLVGLESLAGNAENMYHLAKLAIEFNPNKPNMYFMAGAALMDLQRYDSAVIFLREGLDLSGRNRALKMDFWNLLSAATHELGLHAESDGYLEMILKEEPGNALALNNYAYYLALRKEQLPRALKMAEEANAKSPGQAGYLDTHAWVLYQMGRYPEALVKMEQAIASSNEDSGELWLHYGLILRANGLETKAVQALERAEQLGQTIPVP
jgi:tetratricopeptide (TPR) repeat protein